MECKEPIKYIDLYIIFMRADVTTQQSLDVFWESWLACLKELGIPTEHPAWIILYLNNFVFEQFCTWIILCNEWILFLALVCILPSVWTLSLLYIVQVYLGKVHRTEFRTHIEFGLLLKFFAKGT